MSLLTDISWKTRGKGWKTRGKIAQKFLVAFFENNLWFSELFFTK